MTLKLINWNVQWATPRSRRAPQILERIAAHTPEIVCLTEANVDLFSSQGHVISAGSDYGYGTDKPDRRKVLLWSLAEWSQVDDLGIDSMPPGRYVSGVTETSVGDITVIGICIPWSASRTRRPEPKRMWEDHEQYIAGLKEVLRRAPTKQVILMGDFNQRIGQSGAPIKLRSALAATLTSHMTIVTAGLGMNGRRTIDHIAVSNDLAVESLGVISNVGNEGMLSDHFGVVADMSVLSRR